MTADSFGNDITAVGIPITGSVGIAPMTTPLLTPAAGAEYEVELAAAFRKLGLFTEDGGQTWTLEADGDPIVFFQDGYSIPSGLANATLVVKLAQYDALAQELLSGKVPDANGYITIDAAGHSTEYRLFSEEIFKNGVIRRRQAGKATITGAAVDQSTRGEVNGMEVTFKIDRSPDLNNEHLGEWLIKPGTGVAQGAGS
jgi:hypothetical protein